MAECWAHREMPVVFPRRRTRPVRVGNVIIGGGHPIVVQSMITEPTRHVDACVEAILRLRRAGCEIVRVAAPTLQDARAIGQIRAELERRGESVPLVADVHHKGARIATEVAKHVDKVRINPGLFVFQKRRRGPEWTPEECAEHLAQIERELLPLLEACREHGTALRIGVNHGSLSERILATYGDTPEGMVESALEFIRICEKHRFQDLVISLKASRVPVMIQANRLLVKRMEALGMDYPLHLGVTEAGDGDYARIKSTAGIATLLAEGIGDTIRVSLSEDPLQEIPVCYDILQALGLRRTKTEFIACPSCGRTRFNLPAVLHRVKAATGHLCGLNIAVMGCIVNGPGEMAGADYGLVGMGDGMVAVYRGQERVKAFVPEERGVEELVALIQADGRWVDVPPSSAKGETRSGSSAASES